MEPVSVLIGVDGSEASLEAVRYAARILPRGHAAVTLFHVMSAVPESFWDYDEDPFGAEAEETSRQWRELQKRRMGRFFDEAIDALIQGGVAAEKVTRVLGPRERGVARDIAAEAQRGYTAVIVARRGNQPESAQIIGSVANKIANHLHHFPVWIVGARHEPERLLVAIDSSAGALRALDHLTALVGPRHPEIRLFHVIRGLGAIPDEENGSAAMAWTDAERADFKKRADRKFKKAVSSMETLFAAYLRRMEAGGLHPGKISTKIVTDAPSRAAAILEEAAQGGFGTIVMGRRGLSEVSEFVMGRVCNKVLQRAVDRTVWIVN